MLTATDLLSPRGEVDPGWFPGETVTTPGGPTGTLNERLAGYLDVAYSTLATRAPEFLVNSPDLADDGARAYAYYRARLAVAERMSTDPATLTLADAGSRTYSAEQIRTFKDSATDNLTTWKEVLAIAVPEIEDNDQGTLRAPYGPQRIVPQW